MGGCSARLTIAGQHYECDTECVDFDGNPVVGHDGWAHGNKDAQALWTCGGEAPDA
jgi:hypothetical protein